MIRYRSKSIRTLLLAGAALTVAVPLQGAFAAETRAYAIAAQDLGEAIKKFALDSGRDVAFDPAAVAGKKTRGVSGPRTEEGALRALLEGTGMRYMRTGNGYGIVAGGGPEAAADPEAGNDDIIVTAQKREEKIQDVPIAITAVTGKALDSKKIESGGDLMRTAPNLNFTKTFSSMYNITIRGIGTKALNSSADPGVAVAFNNTPLVRNRLFEQEFFDLARIEVLRGPQGTLYGRNATGGVVNVIPELPNTDQFSGMVRGETGSYSTRRLSGMLNVPLTDTLAIRGAASMTKRSGFDYNEFTRRNVNGRDLWSTRLSAKWAPSSNFSANLIWEHFNEDDDRARSGKALCTPDPGPAMVGNTPVPAATASVDLRGRMSQGCLPESLYNDAAYGVPDPRQMAAVSLLQGSVAVGYKLVGNTLQPLYVIKPGNPYEGVVQSRDPRRISTVVDPIFRAKNDVVQFNMDLNVAEGIKLVSQTAYSRDRWYSSQDYNRFASNPVFNDSRGLLNVIRIPYLDEGYLPGGIYTDPQLGASDRILGVDLNRTRTRQWTQELRLQSDLDGAFNFNIGANYLDFKTNDDYYAFSNLFSLAAERVLSRQPFLNSDTPSRDIVKCLAQPRAPGETPCIYIDPSPIGKTDDLGHNYFLSRNNVRTKSLGIFGEAYFNIQDNLKLTAGIRYTRDKKFQTQIPSQLLLTSSPLTGGTVDFGYPKLDDINQKWGRFTGRIVLDWKPDISFTDATLLYASASRGYKGGGANPPRVDFNPITVQYLPLPATYRPEEVNAFEIGAKNTFFGGELLLNATAFFYDYTDYQVSQVSDRITYTENFPAQSWGLEFEGVWQPSRAFRVDGNFGYLNTRLKKGASSIDTMDRTAGNKDWMVLRPWLQAPANCVAPTRHVETILKSPFGVDLQQSGLAALCPGVNGAGTFDPNNNTGLFKYNQLFGFEYIPTIEAPNGGRGFAKDVSGNAMPNSPKFTFNIGAQYTLFIDNDDWELTGRADYYRQASSYARVYEDKIDKMKGWGNLNLSLTLERPQDDLAFQFYVKNVLNSQPITDVFISADDIGLPANTFYNDPRIFGFNVSKKF